MHNGSYIPLSILNNSIISPRYLLYFNVGRCNAFNLSLYDFLTVLELIWWPFSVHVPVYQYQFFFWDTIHCLHTEMRNIVIWSVSYWADIVILADAMDSTVRQAISCFISVDFIADQFNLNIICKIQTWFTLVLFTLGPLLCARTSSLSHSRGTHAPLCLIVLAPVPVTVKLYRTSKTGWVWLRHICMVNQWRYVLCCCMLRVNMS